MLNTEEGKVEGMQKSLHRQSLLLLQDRDQFPVPRLGVEALSPVLGWNKNRWNNSRVASRDSFSMQTKVACT